MNSKITDSEFKLEGNLQKLLHDNPNTADMHTKSLELTDLK